MAHRKKKAGLLVLMAALCLLLWGCGGNGESGENAEGGKSAVEEAGGNAGSGEKNAWENGESLVPSHTLEELREEAKGFRSQTYPNMDFSGADIAIPEGDEIEELIFPIDADIAESEENYEKIKENFYENIRILTGKDEVDEECVYYMVPIDEEPIHVKDITKEDKKRSGELVTGEAISEEAAEQRMGFYMAYCDEEHSIMLYGSSLMMEVAESRIAGYSEKKGGFMGYRPPEGSVEKSFDIPEDSIEGVSYPVDGKELALKDAVAYVEENLGRKGYHYVCSPFLEYRVFHVDVVRIEEDSYYYSMKLMAQYKGIPFSHERQAAISTADGHAPGYNNVSTSHTAAVMSEGSIDYVWSSAHSYDEKKEGKVYDRFISIGEAADILSRTVSSDVDLKCASVKLLYRTEFHADGLGGIGELQCHPVYQFKFTNTGLPEYPVIYFNVDTQTGMVEATKTLWS